MDATAKGRRPKPMPRFLLSAIPPPTPHRTETKKSETDQAEGGGFGYRRDGGDKCHICEIDILSLKQCREWKRYGNALSTRDGQCSKNGDHFEPTALTRGTKKGWRLSWLGKRHILCSGDAHDGAETNVTQTINGRQSSGGIRRGTRLERALAKGRLVDDLAWARYCRHRRLSRRWHGFISCC
jgi:hypothetical protein